MKQLRLFILAIALVIVTATTYQIRTSSTQQSGAPPYGIAESEIPPLNPWEELRRNWKRPPGPARVGLQVGHLENDRLPEELSQLIGNTGAAAGGYTETEVNLAIAEKTADLLRARGIAVDILPATVPPDYWADAFIAIHADGSTDPSTTGFKIAAPWRDLTGKADSLVSNLEQTYQAATGLRKDDNITRNMRGYYAFSWWRFEHSIHPMTTAVIVETGFLTNRSDRKLIAENSAVPARAIADGIINYLETETSVLTQ